jgi:hypothetical protein
VVTFLFTDVEGSTRRWEADAEGMRYVAVPLRQVHLWLAGTDFMTLSACWPQPAQVVLPQRRQRTG